jgi:alpha-1,6-mannosyltransferase
MFESTASQRTASRGPESRAWRFRGAQVIAVVAAAVALEAVFWRLHQLGNLETFVIPAIVLCFGAGIVYVVALFFLEHTSKSRAAFWLILAAGLLFRLTLLPLAPTLSEDLYRYRWDGRMQRAGENPYAVAPNAPRLAWLHEPGEARMACPDIPAVYPPLSELIFRASCGVFPSPVAFKIPIFVADVLTMLLLAFWFRAKGANNFHMAVYAWNPLVIVEFAGSGHNDALALAAVVAAFVIIRRRPALSTMMLAAATLVKAFPLLFFPAWQRQIGWPRRRAAWIGLLGAAALVLICFWPYRAALPHFFANLNNGESRWQTHNGSLHEIVLHLTGSSVLAGRIGAAFAALVALWAAFRKLPVERAAYVISGTILLLAPNSYPWYFTWMVPWLCFFPNPAWLMLTILQFLSYHVLIGYQILGTWHFEPGLIALMYAPFYLFLIGEWLWKRRHPKQSLS